MIRVTAKPKGGFFAAGMHHHPKPTDHQDSAFTAKQLKELKEIREKADVVVALGTCATHGGIQYLGDNEKEFKARMEYVYGKDGKVPDFHELVGNAQPAEPVHKYIKVDFSIPGCPVEKENFIPIYTKLISGLLPTKYPYPVCVECKFQGNDCFLLHGKYCLGPVTAAGCDACCPTFGVSCVGCFGAYEAANFESMIDKLVEIGLTEEDAKRKLKMFGGEAVELALRGEK